MTLPAGNASGPALRLRIAVLNRNFSPVAGGAERYSMALVEQLSSRHEVHVFAQSIEHNFAGVTYHRVSMPLRRPRWVNQLWFATATWWATHRNFDIVHSHENTWHGNVQTVHVLPVRHTLFVGRKGWSLILRWIKVLTSPRLLTYIGLEKRRYAPQAGRKVVATSPSLQAIMAKTWPACSKMLSVITPGIEHLEPGSPGQKARMRTQLGLPDGLFCLLFVGNDYRKKGLGALLDALVQLPPQVVLAVVGNPAHIPVFRMQAEALNIGSRVFFLGQLADVSPAYQAADMLLHPTLEDTFAMVVLEALGHALPVVVSAAHYCGIAGLLEDELNALILPDPTDVSSIVEAIQRVQTDAVLNLRLATGARAFAAPYQWREIALRQEALYFSSLAVRQTSATR